MSKIRVYWMAGHDTNVNKRGFGVSNPSVFYLLNNRTNTITKVFPSNRKSIFFTMTFIRRQDLYKECVFVIMVVRVFWVVSVTPKKVV